MIKIFSKCDFKLQLSPKYSKDFIHVKFKISDRHVSNLFKKMYLITMYFLTIFTPFHFKVYNKNSEMYGKLWK